MKKVGIITFNNCNNYGASLQAYATYKYLRKIVDEVKFISYDNEYEQKNNKLLNYRKNLSIKSNIIIFVKNFIFRSHAICKSAFQDFNNSLPKTKKYTKKNIELIDKNESFDYIISGSDQIWNPDIFGGKIDINFLLGFKTSAIKISYSSSLGSHIIKDEEEKEYIDFLKQFSSISVREEFAKKELNRIGIENVSVVCDPTLLLNKYEWEEFLPDKLPIKLPEKYLVVYLMSKYENYAEIIKKIADYYNLKIVFVSFSKIKRKYVDYYATGLTPFEFLKLLHDSSLVVTNSFHGTVFSNIFNKDYICLERLSNPVRIREFLKILGTSDREIKNGDNVDIFLKNLKKINYDVVNKIIKNYSNQSQKWLINAIKK